MRNSEQCFLLAVKCSFTFAASGNVHFAEADDVALRVAYPCPVGLHVDTRIHVRYVYITGRPIYAASRWKMSEASQHVVRLHRLDVSTIQSPTG